MMNKAINTLVLATVDSLKKFKNKLAYYFAIFAMVFGSTFGTFNAANATDVSLTGTAVLSQANQNTGAGDDLILDPTGIVVVTTALAIPANKFSDISLRGDNAAANKVTFKVGNTGAITIASNVDATDGKFGTLAVEFATADTAPDLVTLSGTIASTGTTSITVGSATTGGNASFTKSAALTAVDITITGGDHANDDSTLAAQNAVTVTSVSLNDNTGVAKYVLGTDANVTIAGTINAATAGEGTVQVTGATKTFSGIIGATGSIGVLDLDNTSIFNADVSANVIQVIDAKVVTFKDNITATSIALDATSNLTIASASSAAATVITGTIDGIAVNEGIITVTNTGGTTFASAVGATLDVEDVNIDRATTFNSSLSTKGANIAASMTATLKGDVTIGADKLITIGTTTFAGTAAQSVTGAIQGDGSTGAVIVSNAAGVTFNTELGGAVGSDLELQTVTTSGTGEAIISLDGNIVNELLLGTGTTLRLAKTVTNGQTVFTTAAAAQDEASVHADAIIIMPVNLAPTQTIILLDGIKTSDATANTAAAVADANSALQDNAIINYVATNAATDNITVTATAKTDTVAASELSVTTNEARALLQALAASVSDTNVDDALEEIFADALNAEGGLSATADTDLAIQVAPQTDTSGGSAVATRAMTGTVQGIVSNRMASLRSGDAYVTGMSAGNGMSAQSAFIQAFGSEAEQKNTGPATATVYGYDSETSGVAIGFDGMTDTGETIGLSASFSTTDVDGKGTGKSKNSIDSYTVSVYADKATDNGYIEGSLTYGINDNASSRIVNTAGLSRTYTGSYDSQQISLKVGGGAPNEVKDGTFVTPFATATGTLISTDAYTETSTTASDNLRLKIDQDDITSLVGTFGVKAHMVTDNGTPMISLAINNEFGDTEITSSNTYQGGGTAFKTSTDVEELSATLGLGYSFGNDVTSLNINYEANANEEDYVSHYGTVKIVAKF